MKKFILFILSLFIIVIFSFWFFTTQIASFILQREFKTEVSMDKVKASSQSINIKNIVISNPKGSKTKKAFSSKEVNFQYTLKELFSKKTTIDSISFKDTDLNIEFYDADKNNWATLLRIAPEKERKEKQYLIKTLFLTNLKVTEIQATGATRSYPPINITIKNITNETGFPLHEIEKAIAHEILKSALQNLNLRNLLKAVTPKNLLRRVAPLPGTIYIFL